MKARGPLGDDDVLSPLPGAELLDLDGRLVCVGPAGVIGLEDVDAEGLRATLSYVDGVRTVASVAAALGARFDADEVRALLAELEGVLVRRAPAGDLERAARLAAAQVAIVGGGALAASIAEELSRRGIGARRREANGALTGASELVVCAMERVAAGAILELSRAAIAAAVPVLFAVFDGDSASIGPLFVPGLSPCFGCAQLTTKLEATFDDLGPRVLPRLPFGAVPASAPGWWLSRVAYAVGAEVERVVGGTPYPQRIGSLLWVAPDGEARVVPVAAATSCPCCGGGVARVASDASAPPPALRRDPGRVVDRAGGTRTLLPEEAHRRADAALAGCGVTMAHAPLGDDVAGALADFACPFYGARATPRFASQPRLLFPDFRAGCYGKGITEIQARCSATFEWIERNLSTWRGGRELVRAAWDDVREVAVDVPFLVGGLLPGLAMPGRRPFDPREPIDWIWGHRLDRGAPVLVPAACVFFGETRFFGSAMERPRAGSSGLSAGCSLGDAVLQGLLEIVERDATYTALRNGLEHPALDADDVADPAVRALVARVRAAGYGVSLRDITSAVGVPTVEAYVLRPGEYASHFAAGYGAHLDPEIAVRRAVTEAVQALFAYASAPDALRSEASYFEVDPHRRLALGRARGLPRRHEASASTASGDVWAHVDEVVSRVRAAIPRADVCVVDLSSDALPGIHVVRTLVTGAFDEARPIQVHVPERCRLVPLDEMFLGRLAM